MSGNIEDILPGGDADSMSPGDFPSKELKEGKEHELEHTSSEGLAQEIAMDHLAGEGDDYYTRLKEIEKGRKLSRRMKIHGMDISIETDKGELRHWYDPHNREDGTTKMRYPYGYIRRTDGADGEQVDCYIGPNPEEETVYIVRQNKAPDFDRYDEDKVMIGFESAKDAKQAYQVHYNSPKFFDSIKPMSISDFKDSFVNKAFPPNQQEQNPMAPQFNPYDMMDLQAVESMLNQIGGMGDNELVKTSIAIWGDGYQYVPISNNQVRAEIRGFLQDQLEWLKLINPVMAQVDPNFTPDQMPHSSGSSPMSMPVHEDSGVLLQEENLDGKVSQEEMLNYSNQKGSLQKPEQDM